MEYEEDCKDLVPDLREFVDDGWIEPDVRVVRSGKEATVYCCRGAARAPNSFVAAKVYRPLEQRSFRNDAVYREGRFVGDARLTRALKNKSRKGLRTQYAFWINDEWSTLELLHQAGAAVPRPLAHGSSVILMEFLGEDGIGAPALKDVTLTAESADGVYDFIHGQVALFLRQHRIHGDLSAYNILLPNGRPVIIDFPQAVDPRENPNALSLLVRDLANLSNHLARYGCHRNGGALAHALWKKYIYGNL